MAKLQKDISVGLTSTFEVELTSAQLTLYKLDQTAFWVKYEKEINNGWVTISSNIIENPELIILIEE